MTKPNSVLASGNHHNTSHNDTIQSHQVLHLYLSLFSNQILTSTSKLALVNSSELSSALVAARRTRLLQKSQWCSLAYALSQTQNDETHLISNNNNSNTYASQAVLLL